MPHKGVQILFVNDLKLELTSFKKVAKKTDSIRKPPCRLPVIEIGATAAPAAQQEMRQGLHCTELCSPWGRPLTLHPGPLLSSAQGEGVAEH